MSGYRDDKVWIDARERYMDPGPGSADERMIIRLQASKTMFEREEWYGEN